MSVSDILRPDGSDYDPFLHAEVGEDMTGARVTVLSALARLGLEPWTEARELAALRRDQAQARMKSHLGAIRDIPSLVSATGSVATQLVALLPKRASPRAASLPKAVPFSVSRFPVFWVLTAIIVVLVLARIFTLAQSG